MNLNYRAPSIGERNGIRLQYSCLEIPMDSLVGCSPWGRSESDTTERLHFHFSLSCTGEGNGNPLHCSCLENPRDGGAWWVAVYGVAQCRTRLKRLSSSSNLLRVLSPENCQRTSKTACTFSLHRSPKPKDLHLQILVLKGLKFHWSLED